ncbi:glycosyltransferase [Leuconostoc pseudomesenteroides]|uniref:glycosyltransferase n=1 Tax=Leuconostoc pseudomesenteroides TaxID=33968 RepID=UPI0039EA4604
MKSISNVIQFYATYYPIIMTVVWITGAWLFDVRSKFMISKSVAIRAPKVTILLSMYNEEHTIVETLNSFLKVNYSNYDVVLVDDKSEDNTISIVQDWMDNEINKQSRTNIKLIKLTRNLGKAQALNQAMQQINSEFVLVTDADSILAPNAILELLSRFDNERVGAVTGKPVVRSRTTLLGRLQTLEYMGVIDHIKRAQDTLYGGIMTVAGVIVLYRRNALLEVNGFDPLAITEDIDITWRLRRKQWLVQYTPHALVYILVPETLKGYLRQRTRWSTGGLEVLFKNLKWVLHSKSLDQKMLLIDMCLSHIWAWLAVITMVQYIAVAITARTFSLPGVILLIYIVLFTAMLLQGLTQDKQKSKINWYDMLGLPVYSTFYWVTALVTALISQIIVGMFHKPKGSWTSPDRGR